MRPADTALSPPPRGFTVADVARRYRVSPDKVRAWIRGGELLAINTGSVMCGKPRFVVLPQHLAEFERRRAGGPPATPPRRRRRRAQEVDFYPD
jgi:hypothetical protein